MSFSERKGINKTSSLNPNDMPEELKNRLWNVINNYIDDGFRGNISRDEVIAYVWDRFFKEDEGKLRSWISYR